VKRKTPSADKKTSSSEPPRKKFLRSSNEALEFPDGLIEIKKSRPDNGSLFGRVLSENVIGSHAWLVRSASGNVNPGSPLKDINARKFFKIGTPSPKRKNSSIARFPQSIFVKNPESGEEEKLDRAKQFGGFSTYRNTNGTCRKLNFESIDDTNTTTKTVSFTITEKDYNKAQEEKAKTKTRPISQKQVMGESANNVIANRAADDKWEWLHLAAYRFLGLKAQFAGNLVAGRFHANSDMEAVAERYIAQMIKENGSVTIEVTAHIEKNTDIATSIDYKIKRKGYPDIELKFNAKSQIQPSIIEAKYSKKYIDSIKPLPKKYTCSLKVPVVHNKHTNLLSNKDFSTPMQIS
jgi:hypothetical protein